MKTVFRAGWQMDYPALENFLAPIYAKGRRLETTQSTTTRPSTLC